MLFCFAQEPEVGGGEPILPIAVSSFPQLCGCSRFSQLQLWPFLSLASFPQHLLRPASQENLRRLLDKASS